MTCYRPFRAYLGKDKPDGKKNIVFNRSNSWRGKEINMPCYNKCIGCREQRAQEWAIRIDHEAQLWEDNSFITVTYDERHLPKDGSLNTKHIQDFIKRLRKEIYPKKIRYFYSGEYGDIKNTFRPHYHMILFNHDFEDKEEFKMKGENQLYTSKTLEKLWPFGYTSIGTVSYGSASYVARYIHKKQEKLDELGRSFFHLNNLKPEYTQGSTNPGIGHGYFKKYWMDFYPCDYVAINGHKKKVPRYYDQLLDKQNPEMLKEVKEVRMKRKRSTVTDRDYKNRKITVSNEDSFRLPVREAVAEAKSKRQNKLNHWR